MGPAHLVCDGFLLKCGNLAEPLLDVSDRLIEHFSDHRDRSTRYDGGIAAAKEPAVVPDPTEVVLKFQKLVE